MKKVAPSVTYWDTSAIVSVLFRDDRTAFAAAARAEGLHPPTYVVVGTHQCSGRNMRTMRSATGSAFRWGDAPVELATEFTNFGLK